MQFNEHDIVVTICEITAKVYVTTEKGESRETETIPEGTEGTIIHIYERHKGYVVEFPDNKIVSVQPFGEIRLASLKEGYILTWGETDEVHANLITKEHYDKIVAAMLEKTDPEYKTLDNATEEALKTDSLHSWWTQTYCIEPRPYNGIKILGTISIART